MLNKSKAHFQGIGVNFYCNLKIKDKQLITANIVHLCIKEWIYDIVPRIELILNDDGILTEMYPIQDGDDISVELKKNIDDAPINLTFSILSYSAGAMHGGRFMQIVIVGILKVNNFYSPIQYRTFHNQNSKSVFKQLITEGGRALNSSVETNDTMTWIQTSSNLNFCKHVLRRSFISNDCMFLYADTSGKFTYTSYKTEAEKKEYGIARYSLEKYSANKFENKIDYIDCWFNTYNIDDNNNLINNIRAYGIINNFYDPKIGKQSTKLNDDTHLLTELSAKDSSKKQTTSQIWNMGYLPSDNVHKRYYDAMTQNDYYRFNWMSGFRIELNINPLSKPKLFSKIKLIIPSILGPGENETLSGDYLIAGIVHDVVMGDSYKKRIVLIRNGNNVAKHDIAPAVNQPINSSIPAPIELANTTNEEVNS